MLEAGVSTRPSGNARCASAQLAGKLSIPLASAEHNKRVSNRLRRSMICLACHDLPAQSIHNTLPRNHYRILVAGAYRTARILHCGELVPGEEKKCDRVSLRRKVSAPGEVAAIGDGVTRVKIGDRIAGCFHPRWFG